MREVVFKLTEKLSGNKTEIPLLYLESLPTILVIEIIPEGRFCYDLDGIEDITKNPSVEVEFGEEEIKRTGYRRYLDISSAVFSDAVGFCQYRFIFSRGEKKVFRYLQYYNVVNKSQSPEYIYSLSQARKYGFVPKKIKRC